MPATGVERVGAEKVAANERASRLTRLAEGLIVKLVPARVFLFMRAFVGLVVIGVMGAGMGCGSPKAGDKCNSTGFFCADLTTALECRSGVWVSLPCKGKGGCVRDADLIRCDMSGNAVGDNCATSAEAKGLCAQDGLSTLECRDGKLVRTSTCTSCSVASEEIRCTP